MVMPRPGPSSQQAVASGRGDEVVLVSRHENVAGWSMAHSFARGNWALRGRSAPLTNGRGAVEGHRLAFASEEGRLSGTAIDITALLLAMWAPETAQLGHRR
jgi:hypothetical protein